MNFSGKEYQTFLMETIVNERKCFSLLETALEKVLDKDKAQAVFREYHKLRIENNVNYL